MVEQVNRLIGNMLAANKTVGLPGVGSLRKERRPARRIDNRTIAPPCHVVEFSSTVAGTVLPDEIARALTIAAQANGAQPDKAAAAAQAQDIYGRWLNRTLQEGVLTISGIGILKNKHFTLDETFDARLNPQGHTPVRIKRKRSFDWTIALGCTAVCIAAVIGIFAYGEFSGKGSLLGTFRSDAPAPQIAEATAPAPQIASQEELEEPSDTDRSSSETAGTPASATPAAPSSETESAPAASDRTDAPTTSATQRDAAAADKAPSAPQAATSAPTAKAYAQLVSGRRYVVLGVFSSLANAERAAREATEKDGSFRCGVYSYGPKFMVSPFESEDSEACAQFIRGYGDRFPGMWTYTAR